MLLHLHSVCNLQCIKPKVSQWVIGQVSLLATLENAHLTLLRQCTPYSWQSYGVDHCLAAAAICLQTIQVGLLYFAGLCMQREPAVAHTGMQWH